MPPETISFIGLGIMGKPMALNLINSGHRLFVHARRASATQPLVAAGATACLNPRQAMQASDFCIVMVSDTPDVEEVLFDENGVIQGASEDNVVIVMSTISPEETCKMANRLKPGKIHLLDAPVSGGEQGAITGELSIMVGGEKPVFERARPLFERLGQNIVHVGATGAGQIAKMCNQLLSAQTIAAVAEAFAFARAAGVDCARVREALLGGFANSKVLELHGQRMLDADYAPGFKARLHLKDMNIAAATATAGDLHLPGTENAHRLLRRLVDDGEGELDSSAIGKVVFAQAHRS